MIYHHLGTMIQSTTTTSKVVRDLGKQLRAIKETEKDLQHQTGYALTLLQFLVILAMPFVFHLLAWALGQTLTTASFVYLALSAAVISFLDFFVFSDLKSSLALLPLAVLLNLTITTYGGVIIGLL